MNVLISDFPEAIDVGGQIIDIDFDYKNCIQIILAWEDKLLTIEEKAFITLSNLYLIDLKEIENPQLAVEKAIKFLNCGEYVDPGDEDEKIAPKKRVYSFEKDSKFVFTAVDSVLDGKLSENKDVHWWVFSMAFMEIPEDCMLSKIISLRTQKNKGKMSKEEKKFYNDNRDIMELDIDPNSILNKEQEESLDTFMKLLNGEAEVAE